MRPFALAVSATLALLSGCASEPRLPLIPNGDSVTVVVTLSPEAASHFDIRNEALGSGASTGAGTGLVLGSLWGFVCGPLAVLCVPLGAATGAITGSTTGAIVGVTGALPDQKAEKLRQRMGQLMTSHALDADLQRNITARAQKYWKLGADNTGTQLVVWVQDIQLMSTRDEQIRCAVRAIAWVNPPGQSAVRPSDGKHYEYVAAYNALNVWLDPDSDFADTVLSAASQQIAAQIVADLTSH